MNTLRAAFLVLTSKNLVTNFLIDVDFISAFKLEFLKSDASMKRSFPQIDTTVSPVHEQLLLTWTKYVDFDRTISV